MTDVVLRPIPKKFLRYPQRLWPCHPPIFHDIGPNGVIEKDRQLARELFELLDRESQDWYAHDGIFLGL